MVNFLYKKMMADLALMVMIWYSYYGFPTQRTCPAGIIMQTGIKHMDPVAYNYRCIHAAKKKNCIHIFCSPGLKFAVGQMGRSFHGRTKNILSAGFFF